MNQKILALALAGTLMLAALAGCSSEPSAQPGASAPAGMDAGSQTSPAPAGDPSPTPGQTGVGDPPLSPTPDQLPEPELTPAATPVQIPEPDITPAATPTQLPEAATPPQASATPTPEAVTTPPAPETSANPAGDSALTQLIWTDISELELPALMDLDSETLAAVYGIDSGDLKEYVCKIPLMNVHATEFFIARAAEGKLDVVKAAVERRQADLETQWGSYLPDQLELVKNYKLIIQGDYLFFAVSESADEAAALFNGYFDH